MDIEDEIKEIKNAILVMHRELFQANKIPRRFYLLEERVKKLESKGKHMGNQE